MGELKACDIALLEKRLKNLSDGLRGMDGDIMVNKAMLTACRDYMAELLVLRCAAPENKPLTLDELRQMGGEPVWIVVIDEAKPPICEIVVESYKDGIKMVNVEDPDDYGAFDLYGKTWLAYVRRPEPTT